MGERSDTSPGQFLPIMLYCKTFSLKRGILLVFLLTTIIVFLMAHHLFMDSKWGEVISMSAFNSGRVLFTSEMRRTTSLREHLAMKNDGGNMKHSGTSGVVKVLPTPMQRYRNTSNVAKCRDALCTNYLSTSDMSALFECQRNATRKRRRGHGTHDPLLTSLHRDYSTGALSSGKCQFREGKGGGGLVGLVSYPGSGNTWVRGLLQKVTGICTGAVYCDSMLRLSGFDGEGLQSTAVLVVKFHSAAPGWTKKLNHPEYKGVKYKRKLCDSVIFLIRNPFHALVSEWNRKLSLGSNQTDHAHVEFHGQEHFLAAQNWSKFMVTSIARWSKTFSWITERPKDHEILVVRYEDVQSDEQNQMMRMLKFLHYDISAAELSERLKGGVSIFRRRKKAEFEHFTSEQRRMLDAAIFSVERLLLAKTGQSFGVEEYLREDN